MVGRRSLIQGVNKRLTEPQADTRLFFAFHVQRKVVIYRLPLLALDVTQSKEQKDARAGVF